VVSRALVDTSVFVAHESGRRLDAEAMPDELAVSAITIGELRAGVLMAASVAARDQRLRTLESALGHEPIPVDEQVATQWARLRVELREAGRRMGVNDSWIAATALAHGLPLVTQDGDFDDTPGLAVVRV
jgi:predicted nucleic acid-binding protein